MPLTTTIARKVPALLAAAMVTLAVTWCGWTALAVTSVPRANAADPNYQLIQEPDAGYVPIISLISNAVHSIRFTIYELSDPSAVSATSGRPLLVSVAEMIAEGVVGVASSRRVENSPPPRPR